MVLKRPVTFYLCLTIKQQGLGRVPGWPHLQVRRVVSDCLFCSRVIICVPYAIPHCIWELISFYLLDGYLHFPLMHIYDAKSVPVQIAGFHYHIHQLLCGREKVPAEYAHWMVCLSICTKLRRPRSPPGNTECNPGESCPQVAGEQNGANIWCGADQKA